MKNEDELRIIRQELDAIRLYCKVFNIKMDKMEGSRSSENILWFFIGMLVLIVLLLTSKVF